MGVRYRRREQGCLLCLRQARQRRPSCLQCVSDTSGGDWQTRVRVAGGRAASTQPSTTILPATHRNSGQARGGRANQIKSMIRRLAETSDRVYPSIEGDMQAPKRAPPTHPQRTQKQSSITRRSSSMVQRPAETSKKSTCRRQTCKYPTEHPTEHHLPTRRRRQPCKCVIPNQGLRHRERDCLPSINQHRKSGQARPSKAHVSLEGDMQVPNRAPST